LIINPFLPANSSPLLLNPPLDNGCVGQCFEHNPGAYDLDGDSLAYRLDTCYGNGKPISVYQYPEGLTPESINHTNGDIVWCQPTQICQYNIAIVIEEWKLLQGKRYFVGSILRDMQIDIGACLNDAPLIKPVNDTCIAANTQLNFTVTATDPNNNKLTLTATGGPFIETPKATFVSKDSIKTVTGKFSWKPDCSQIRLLPYQVSFKVDDNALPDALVNFETVAIRVVAPAVTGLAVKPVGTSMELTWNEPFCKDTLGVNRIVGYKIYRKKGCDPWVHSPCEVGVPAYTGDTLIGKTDYKTLHFTDTNNGLGLIHGTDYTYIVVAIYLNEAESYASAPVCAHLVRDVPIITNVSVLTTNTTSGSIWIHWAKPLGIAPNLDTINNPPPYEFRLFQAEGMKGTNFSQINSISYSAYFQVTDTGFVSNALNTEEKAYKYRVDFYSNGILKGSTYSASSVFLKSVANDKQLKLTWEADVPWINYQYFIYKELPLGSGLFKLLDSTTVPQYTEKGLINNVLYCYKIVTKGQYGDSTLPHPLFNTSQIKCDRPHDYTPPCQPALTMTSNCDLEQNLLSWRNPNNYCIDHDVIRYNIYYSTTDSSKLELIDVIMDVADTTYSHSNKSFGLNSIAGCYAITAVDSAGNESPIVSTSCVDNCPSYELPNVFTPNGDNQNDFFTPLPNYRFVKDISIKIYDRWGLLMFETNDPNIMWNGTNKNNKRPCPGGTYFYVCTINEIKLQGIVPRELHGFIELIKDGVGPQK
jgi:gliding motility-associated-like protein